LTGINSVQNNYTLGVCRIQNIRLELIFYLHLAA